MSLALLCNALAGNPDLLQEFPEDGQVCEKYGVSPEVVRFLRRKEVQSVKLDELALKARNWM